MKKTKKLRSKELRKILDKVENNINTEITEFEKKYPKFKGKIFSAVKAMFSTKKNPFGMVAVVRIKDFKK